MRRVKRPGHDFKRDRSETKRKKNDVRKKRMMKNMGLCPKPRQGACSLHPLLNFYFLPGGEKGKVIKGSRGEPLAEFGAEPRGFNPLFSVIKEFSLVF
jgi:hypothetical protein